MRYRAAIIGLFFIALQAQAYQTDLRFESQGLDIEAIPNLIENATVVRLINHEKVAVRCDVVFRNGPELSRPRKINIKAGDTGIARFSPSRSVIRLQIDIECWHSDTDR
ncbi:MAG: hypothetical protein OEU49_11440 [Chromatiales bacterium]|jgi:hypothetical protein|nr:hypothetical protein [Chromatiales bacterium]MDH3946914.1 hypothetical protein [Chromatiales bacterium]MDH4031453.1 hypothetical protein [Chromatiales bacterium]